MCLLNNARCLKTPPRDVDYFLALKQFAYKYGKEKIYDDYVIIYNKTNKTVQEEVLTFITCLSSFYTDDKLEIDKIFSILYMAMISEENKKYTRLGKRIKRLGIYSLLIEGKSIEESANFMKGKNWREIDSMCVERGF